MTLFLNGSNCMKVQYSGLQRIWQWLAAVSSACLLMIAAAHGQGIVQSWEGIRGPDPSGSVGPPPDPHGAPGPDGVLATANLAISYFTKAGTLMWGPTNLPAFFTGNTGTGNQNADPRVLFDQGSRRFFVIMQEDHNSRLWLNVAVSRNSDPRSSGAGDWIIYRFDATEYTATNTAGGVNYGGDYPGMAIDSQALYVAYRMFAFDKTGAMSGCGCDVLNSALLIMNKAQLIAGTGTLTSLYTDGVTLQPVTPMGGGPGNVMYMVADWNATNLKLYALSDPLNTRTLTTSFVTITDIGDGPNNEAPQLGSTNTVDPIVGKMQGNATLIGDDLWCCMTRGQAGGPAVAAYWQIRLNGWPFSGKPTLEEEGTVGASTDWNYLPAIGANQAGDLALTWTRSSSTRYPAMMVAWRTAYASTFGAPIVVKDGPTANNDGRWGDYFSVWPDPNDGSLWAVSEWTRTDTATWSTWWTQISMPPRDFFVNWNAAIPGTQDGSPAFPYTTIGAAHANITSGTIHIFGGHYNEKVTLNKSVRLEAYSGGPVTIGAP